MLFVHVKLDIRIKLNWRFLEVEFGGGSRGSPPPGMLFVHVTSYCYGLSKVNINIFGNFINKPMALKDINNPMALKYF